MQETEGDVHNVQQGIEDAQPAAQSKKPRAYMTKVHRREMAEMLLKEMTSRLDKQQLAGICDECGKQFVELHPTVSPAKARRYVKSVLKRLNVTGSLEDAPRSGRPRQISEGETEEACKLFLAGLEPEPNFIGFTSIKHALRECSELQRIKLKCNLTTRGLWKAMKKHRLKSAKCPFKRIVLTFKGRLEEANRAERLKVAEEWLKCGRQDLLRFVFLDEKTEYFKVQGSYCCYAPDHLDSDTRESPVPLKKGAKVKWLAAVCGLVGPVFFALTTGTKGLHSHYQVCTFIPLWA